MKAVLTKVFHFSASYEKDHKVFASNYRLGVTTTALDESEEAVFEKKIQESDERLCINPRGHPSSE